MGQNGPVPKHSSERIRRNQDEGPIDTITAIGTPQVPELDILGAHQIVRDLYQGMRNSAQSRFFEESDWAYARLTLMFLNDYIKQNKPSAMMVSSLDSMLSKLLLTEGDRRRVRLEIERTGDQKTASVTSIADHYRQQLGVGT